MLAAMDGLRTLTYVDSAGRKLAVQLPDEAPDSEAKYGIPLGPPPLKTLGLPIQIEVRLNNELHGRGLLTRADVVRRRADVVGALMTALAVDVDKIVALYSAATAEG